MTLFDFVAKPQKQKKKGKKKKNGRNQDEENEDQGGGFVDFLNLGPAGQQPDLLSTIPLAPGSEDPSVLRST